jgi:methylenetetrahydrofolate dehydrogenase (NADP+)/methenyltetrahydrofolate cyclohydrolase
MSARILDGKAVAAKVREKVAAEALAFARERGRKPGLEVVLVGEDPASQVYVRNKEKAAEQANLRGALHRLPHDTSALDLLGLVRRMNEDAAVDGILVQLPLPKGLNELEVVDAIDPRKDVDGLHPVNAGYLAVGREGLRPCTPRGCMRLIEETGLDLAGKSALVIGRSNLVGKPIAQMLLAAHATVTMAHSRTPDLAERARAADVLIAAVGRPELVRGDWVKEGAVVIDVGINRRADGSLVGDVEFAAAKERASWITPVPGGVGPMTIAMLLDNTLRAARARG